MADDRSLLERIRSVREKMTPVPKNGIRYGKRGEFQFAFPTHDDVILNVDPLCRAEGILITSECNKYTIEWQKIGDRFVCTVIVEEKIRLRLAGTDQEEFILSPGAASGDATAVGVARTYAKKYGLLNYFLMEQGEESDLELRDEDVKPRSVREEVEQPRSRSKSRTGREEPEPVEDERQSKPKSRGSRSASESGTGIGANIAEKEWDKVNMSWHNKGVLKDSQIDRLLDTAKESGWSEDEVRALILAKLDVDIEDLPYGGPFNAVMKIFTSYEPSR